MKLEKMKLSKYEKETIINFNEEEATATIYTYNNLLKKKLAEFSAKSPTCQLIKTDGESVDYEIPKKWVTIRLPRQYTEETKKKLSARAKETLRKDKAE